MARDIFAFSVTIITIICIFGYCYKEVWFSNPLFMNDIEEVRFGLNTGANLFMTSTEIESACGTKERFDRLKTTFNHYYEVFANDHVINTYVFCLSEHAKDDLDGLLSMWRGYGGNGNGVLR
jgi:hypothetical protein